MQLNASSAIVLLLFVGCGILLVYAGLFIASTLRPPNFPPGPPVIPGLGNLHQIPLRQPYLTYTNWAKTYGPVLGLKAGPGNVVVLNNADHVRELFSKRGAHYAARPHMSIPCDYVLPGEHEKQVVFMSVSFQQRARVAYRPYLSRQGIEEMTPIQQAMGARLMYNLLRTPENFGASFRHWTLSVPFPMIGGQRVEDLGQEWVDTYHKTQELWLELLEPGVAPPVDIFPILGLVPAALAKWKRKARYVREQMRKTYGLLMEHAKQRNKEYLHGSPDGEGNAARKGKFESLIFRLLRERSGKEGADLSETDIEFIGGGLLDAAADTTLEASQFLLQAFATHPEIQRRAQAEIDASWGRESMPEHIDLAKFPYLKACLTEVLRWRPPTPLAVPRLCLKDENVLGYRIPKGTVVIMNAWAIQHDPEEYDQPEKFDPERFMRNPLGTKHTPAPEDKETGRKPLYTFGLGRRACPGEQFVFNAIQLTFAQLLWAYDVIADGDIDISVETGFHSGLTITPHPFNAKIVPRSERAAQVVVDEYHRANQVLADLLP
ncbi:cytochrome P450 [Thozetella sp. PMI_491]|nr:cytochrome P450 [Thozetella sp. PMI_491]